MTIEPLKQMALMSGYGKKNSWERDDHKLPKIGAMRIRLNNSQEHIYLIHKFWSTNVYLDERKEMAYGVGINKYNVE